MGARPDTDRLTPAEQVEAIIRHARNLAHTLPDLPEKHRKAAEKRIAKAYDAIRHPKWSMNVLRSTVLLALVTPADLLAKTNRSGGRPGWDEDRAVTRAIEGIAGVMKDPWCPVKGRVPSRPVVLKCLRAWGKKRGNQPKGTSAVSKGEAALELFRELGIAPRGEDQDACEKLIRRYNQRRRREVPGIHLLL